MLQDVVTVRITEAELVLDVRAVLEKVQQGSEVIIEREITGRARQLACLSGATAHYRYLV